MSQQILYPSEDSGGYLRHKDPKPRRRHPFVAVVVIILLIVLGIGTYFGLNQHSETHVPAKPTTHSQAAVQKPQQKHPTVVVVKQQPKIDQQRNVYQTASQKVDCALWETSAEFDTTAGVFVVSPRCGPVDPRGIGVDVKTYPNAEQISNQSGQPYIDQYGTHTPIKVVLRRDGKTFTVYAVFTADTSGKETCTIYIIVEKK